jgi:hypothetical protein
MTRGKQTATQLLVLVTALIALLVAFPASADSLACPTGWNETPVAQGTTEDKNADGEVCLKTNPNGKVHMKDNHDQR